VFAGTLPVVAVSEAIAFKALAYSALCHSTVIFVVDGAGYAVIWGILVMAPDTRAGQGDLISFAVPLCRANGTAAPLLDGRKGRSDPLRGCTDIPYLRQRVLRRA